MYVFTKHLLHTKRPVWQLEARRNLIGNFDNELESYLAKYVHLSLDFKINIYQHLVPKKHNTNFHPNELVF
jgi:hypothetical protein